jgi:hypothetical protein
MSNPIETVEVKRFHESLIQEIKSIQITEEEGGTLEQIFTQWAIDLLAGGGETENVRVAYDEKALGTKNQHKINAYSISDNYETIDVFIAIFKGSDAIVRIAKDEIDTATKRIANFIRKGIYKDYVNEIEESSPIFDFAHTLSNSAELKQNLVRVNAIILTDGLYPSEFPTSQNISGYPIYYRIIDVEYLFNISEKVHIPIEIDFKSEGFSIPCIISPSENDQYQSYLAIIPGIALANIYERFGSRLLEQNVRSFLQFTGKINKGIRNTILKESYMFLAFNNGIAATAEEIEIEKSGNGYMISKVKDFQIVNGGQTTASIYHTFKKDRADISGISVQLKLSVVKNKDKFSEIVSRISEYANTQNKVSVSDLSSNTPYHIEIEKLSRNIVAPHIEGQANQTKWFYERARGQYKNARIKEGFTKAKQKAFDLKNPKTQMFTKEDLAKYVNAYREVYEGKKLVVGPHFVVRGNQKNYVQFINYNLTKSPDSIYYEDVIAKAILFRTAERLYGVKPNSIGDMRYITVPYTISLFNHLTEDRLDLYKVWRNQAISERLKNLLYNLMKQIESFIKDNAPGALYGEWAKKEECWIEIKKQNFIADLALINDDLEDSKNPSQRRRMTDEESSLIQQNDEIAKIRSVPPEIWRKIEDWGRLTELLSHQQRDVAYNLRGRVRSNTTISDKERSAGILILDTVINHAPELLFEIDDLQPTNNTLTDEPEVTLDLIKKMVEWDKKNKRLKDHHFKFMLEIVKGNAQLNDRAKKYAAMNYKTLLRFGFKD